MAAKHKVTRSGLEKAQKELNWREFEERNRIAEAIKHAKSLGDFSENADLDAAKEDNEKNESEILKLRDIIENYEIITASKYRIYDTDDEQEYVYELVGPSEVNIKEGKIAIDSPFGKAVENASEGDVVTIKVNDAYSYKVKILEILENA